MLFNSVAFLVFFPLVAAGYYLVPHRFRWGFLLAASYIFYMSWRPEYALLLLFVTAVSFTAARRMASQDRQGVRKALLTLGVAANLGVLFTFKYFNFFNDSVRNLLGGAGVSYPVPDLEILLPVGISFYTLQAIGYLVDVYRGVTGAENHPGRFALFLSFFPQLVAGPIERAKSLLPQFLQPDDPDYDRIVSGLQRMAWGFFKKLVIADRLGPLVDVVYADPTRFTGAPLILATYAFAFQIYCDFSGYADIAIGAARVLGIRLMENFNLPYAATSIPDFWRRWHISLSIWLRDYIFYPLSRALIRRNPSRTSLVNLVVPPLITMLASGLWHGANWTFVVWGGLHGVLMVLSVAWSSRRTPAQRLFDLPAPLMKAVKIFLTFNLVSFTWIFFRAGSLGDALYVARNLFTDVRIDLSLFGLMPGGRYEVLIAALGLFAMTLVHWLRQSYGSVHALLGERPAVLRWSLYYVLVLSILMFGRFGLSEFIYFQF